MIPSPFTYQRAGSVSEALSLLAGDAQALAGGQSLIPAMKLRLNQPEKLVDLSRIAALRQIEDAGDHLVIGSMATHGMISDHPLVAKHAGFIAHGAGLIGDIQVRNKGTIGGSMAHADPAADWPALLIAADATVALTSANGNRTLPAADFFTGFYETALEEGELITAVHLPKMGASQRGSYQKFVQPASRFAIVGVAVALTTAGGKVTAARVGITGLADRAYLDTAVAAALVGQPATAATAAAAAQAAGEVAGILADHYASEEYRQHLAKVYTKRAILACL